MHPSPLGRDKIGTMREGFLRALPFSLPFGCFATIRCLRGTAKPPKWAQSLA